MIAFRFICGNKKCLKEISIVENNDKEIVEVTINFNDQTLEYVCPHCRHENKILIGRVDQRRLPGIGGVHY